MKSFYTNVQIYGSSVLYRGIENGKRVRQKIEYLPTLYLASQSPAPFKTIHGEYLAELKPGTIREAREFVKKYDGVEGFAIYGNQRYEYAFISEVSDDIIDWDASLLTIANIDIEVASERGFPEPSDATEPITAITYKTRDRFIVLGCGDFVNTRSDVIYLKCVDEIDLIKRFVDIWTGDYPDIVTGWNVKFFDIPYIINRITRLLGEKVAKRLSPWNYLGERSAFIMGREQKSYAPSGISILDYIDLYKKFAAGGQSQESYKLNAIAHAELGETKLSFAEYGDLHTMYKKNYQKFIEYNIRDVELVGLLDDKLKLIDLALTLAYNSKTNFDDVFSQVRMWDALIFNHLKKKNIILPPMKSNSKEVYPGAHVKSPILGMHKYVVSFDLNSMYPMLISGMNIGPDTLIEPEDYVDAHRAILMEGVSVDSMLECQINTSKLKELNCAITPNGQFFRTDQQGFLAAMMESMYADRKKFKIKTIEKRKELELVYAELERRKASKEVVNQHP